MSPSDQSKIQEIRQEIEDLIAYLQEKTEDDLLNEYEPKKCVRDALAVIGEASGKISEECRREYSFVPWREMKDLRNILVHNYGGVDWNVVLDTLKNKLPRLREKLGYLKLPSVKPSKVLKNKKKKSNELLPKKVNRAGKRRGY